MRAAKRITNMVRSTPVSGLTENENMDNMAAQIIDRETGMAELSASVAELLEAANNAIGHGCGCIRPLQCEVRRKLDRAIAKCERKE